MQHEALTLDAEAYPLHAVVFERVCSRNGCHESTGNTDYNCYKRERKRERERDRQRERGKKRENKRESEKTRERVRKQERE